MKKTLYFAALFLIIPLLHVSAQTWMDEADMRIEEIRKGNFNFIILDSLGNVHSHPTDIQMAKHEFPWGSVALVPGTDYSDWGLATLAQYFNYGVWGNDFKWPWIEPEQGTTFYDDVDKTLYWAEKNGIKMRGHTLIWGGSDSWKMPSWTTDASMSAEDLYDACETHIKRDVAYYKGKMTEYDVVNEPVHETWLAEKAGDSINWNAFKWAKDTDPDARMYVNDFNILVWNSVDDYVAMIRKMLNNGAPIDGIGVQCHFDDKIDWEDIKTKLDKVAGLGLPVKVTEFDMNVDKNGMSDKEQAEGYARMMHLAFSHPSVDGFVLWSLCDNFAWRAGSGIYDENFIPKPAADTVLSLIHEYWSTQLPNQPASNDTFRFRGFYGDYDITVDFGDGKIRTFKVPAYKAYEDSTFILEYNSSYPVKPEIVSASINKFGDKVNLLFNRKMNGNFSYKDISIYSIDGIDITSSGLINDSTIELSIGSEINARQFVGIYYTGDTIKGLNGATVDPFGPLTVNNPLPYFISAETNSSGDTIYVSFSDEMMEAVPRNEFTLTIDDNELSLAAALINPKNPKEIILLPSSSINTGTDIRLSFEEGLNYGNKNLYILKSFGPKYVLNNVDDGSSGLNKKLTENIDIYPNPVNDLLKVSNLAPFNTLEIIDANGRKIYFAELNGAIDLEINTSEFPSGFLFIKLTSKEENTYVHKIIKH